MKRGCNQDFLRIYSKTRKAITRVNKIFANPVIYSLEPNIGSKLEQVIIIRIRRVEDHKQENPAVLNQKDSNKYFQI